MNKTSKEKEAVLNVFAALVRPLMRVAFEYGISAGEIAGVVRRGYIQALEARLQEQSRPTTDARLAAVAGLPRSDVSALRDALRAGAPHSLANVSLDQITALLTVWHTHSNFSGAYGLAMDLDLQVVQGSPRRTFKELVAIACPGVDEDALLDELVAARSVEIIDGNTARCLSRAYVPQTADVTRIDRMGRFLGLVTQSFVHNLLRNDPDPSYFERTVISDEPLSALGRDNFISLANEKGQELLSELDTALTHVTAAERSASGKKYGVGFYFFEDSANEPSERQIEKNYQATSSAQPPVIEEIDVLAMVRRKD
ncbi:MAG: hypothetical protein JWO04_5190 [Gammaproteobacteria bacterium]|nr:hypothetical protein [Gammaproteobacteria bacterium]